MMPETFAERKEQWEGIVPGHLRAALLFRQEPKKRRSKLDKDEAIAVEEFVPDGFLWDWATSDPRRLATLYELAQQLRAQWCETRGAGAPDRFSLTAPLRLTLHAKPLPSLWSAEWKSLIQVHDFPGVYRALLELLTRKTSSLPMCLGTQGISRGLREAIHWYSLLESAGGDSWIHLHLEQLEELSAIVSAWSTRASGPTLRKLRTNHALRKIGPQPDVFSTLLSMHGLMVRQIGVPGVHTSRSDFNKQTHGSMHRTDGTFEIALTFNSHDFQPPKEQP